MACVKSCGISKTCWGVLYFLCFFLGGGALCKSVLPHMMYARVRVLTIMGRCWAHCLVNGYVHGLNKPGAALLFKHSLTTPKGFNTLTCKLGNLMNRGC